MSVKAIGFPEIPPAGPWDSYVLVIIWLPLVMRIVLLLAPFRKAISKLAPHTGWALKQLKNLPIRGFGLLALNEKRANLLLITVSLIGLSTLIEFPSSFIDIS